MTSIYLASSWRNQEQPSALLALRAAGHSVYDFRNPDDPWDQMWVGDSTGGFRWSDIDPQWEQWTPWAYRQALTTEIAGGGFANDYKAMVRADTGVLLLPSGRSAHIEAGYFVGHPDKRLFVVIDDRLESGTGWEPELMYNLSDGVYGSIQELIDSREL